MKTQLQYLIKVMEAEKDYHKINSDIYEILDKTIKMANDMIESELLLIQVAYMDGIINTLSSEKKYKNADDYINKKFNL